MGFDLSSISTAVPVKPPIIIVYGVEGIGKTRLGIKAPQPVVLQTEDGLSGIEEPVAHFDLASSFNDVGEALMTLKAGGHGYSTLVVDSLDWLETLIWNDVAKDQKVKNIEDIGYGKGYQLAVEKWLDYMDALTELRSQGMTIIQTAHSEVKRFDDPNNDPYDRYQIKLHKSASAKLREHADVVLFANYRISTTANDTGFNNKKTRAIGSGERLVFTEERPGYMAKNRFTMPSELPLSWESIAEHIPYFKQGTK